MNWKCMKLQLYVSMAKRIIHTHTYNHRNGNHMCESVYFPFCPHFISAVILFIAKQFMVVFKIQTDSAKICRCSCVSVNVSVCRNENEVEDVRLVHIMIFHVESNFYCKCCRSFFFYFSLVFFSDLPFLNIIYTSVELK